MLKILTSDNNQLKNLFKDFVIPQVNSHKGQNGKLLIIGGSSLFHSAVLWSAETASHFVDMVHFASTIENNEIFTSIKKIFRNGIVIEQQEIFNYANEDDVILLGTGMVRAIDYQPLVVTNYQSSINVESQYTYQITLDLINKFPNKQLVIDAGALQMMKKEWLLTLTTPAIITPHQKEFEIMFSVSLDKKSLAEKVKIVSDMAQQYKTIILLKTVVDIVSNGATTYVIEGGNAGLTKGGTGDVLAALTASFATYNNPLLSAVFASILLKKTSEALFKSSGYWYNVSDIINLLPEQLVQLTIA